MNDIPLVTPEQWSLSGSPTACKPKKWLVSRQKSAEWMTYLVINVYETGELVLNTFNGTLASAKASLSLPEHYRFPKAEIDSAHFQDGLLSLVEVYPEQTLSEFCWKAYSNVAKTCKAMTRDIFSSLVFGKRKLL